MYCNQYKFGELFSILLLAKITNRLVVQLKIIMLLSAKHHTADFGFLIYVNFLQMILFPIYFVVLLVILKVAAFRPRSFPSMSNNETLSYEAIVSMFSSRPYQILLAPNISGTAK